MGSKRLMGVMTAAVLVAVCAIFLPRLAQAADFTKDTCDVTSPDWLMYPSAGGLSLLKALWHASKAGDKNVEHCLKTIRIGPRTIHLGNQLYIKGNGTGEGDRFTLIGNSDATDKVAIMDAGGDAGELAKSAPAEKCVVRIVGQFVTLQNIRIANVPTGWDAVCIENQNVVMDAVDIKDGGGDGIVFAAEKGDVIDGVIKATSRISGMKGYAINFGTLGQNTFNLNKIEPVTSAVRTPIEAAGTNEFGVMPVPDANRPKWGPDTTDLDADGDKTEEVFSPGNVLGIASADVARFFKSESPVQVCVKNKIQQTGTTKVRIRGWAVNYSGDITGKLAHADAPVSQEIRRLQIYDGRGFLGWVGPWKQTDILDADKKPTGQKKNRGMGQNMANGDNEMLGYTGYFDFELEGAVGKIVLVPEESDGKIGRASNIIDVSAGGATAAEVPCTDWELGDGVDDPGNAGGGGGSGPSGVVFKGFTSMQDCVNKRATLFGEGIASYYDSDGDGVYDDTEDADTDCVCDSRKDGPAGHNTTDESCWWKFDSDGDGIPDGAGKETIGDDTDCDTTPNVLDDDSDGDGVADGSEDRNQSFKKQIAGNQVKGLLYRYQSLFGLVPVEDLQKNEPMECSLNVDNGKEIGVRYAWYIVTCADNKCTTFSANPKELQGGFGSEAPPEGSSQRLAVLVCRNKSLIASANFNGSRQEGNLELDPWNTDTDNDTYCDGSKCGKTSATDSDGKKTCVEATGKKVGDNCPLVTDDDNSCELKTPCYGESIRYGVLPKFFNADGPVDEIDWEGNQGGDSVPDFLQVDFAKGSKAIRAAIEKNCPVDTDDDGIPDCVENPFGECPASQGEMLPNPDNVSSMKLKHYMADSDGDTFIDGWKGAEKEDVCPESSGANDGFVDKKTNYSCDPRKIYTLEHMKVLSCFLDRDNDGLRDCEEDIDLDGDYDKKMNIASQTFEGGKYKGISEEMMASLETDPLDQYSDEDTLSDKDERMNSTHTLADGTLIFTNPLSADTDGDTIKDGDEIREGTWIFDEVQGSEGCPDMKSFTLDTDPTSADTDGDGLKDNIELDGGLIVNDVFLGMIKDPALWNQVSGGIDTISNPRSKDSDNDGLEDGKEYNGLVTYNDSNPCMRDSDNDTVGDVEANEQNGCALNPDLTCKGSADGIPTGVDGDSDGLPDSTEAKLGTDKLNPDTDGDHIKDGDEDKNHNGIVEPNLGESNPLLKDSDEDGLEDDREGMYGTDANVADSDGDCMGDGVEDANHNGKYDPAETNALSADSDGDGLPDGKIKGIGEDLNCNGVRDTQPDGSWAETDPTNPDSDFDGGSDFDEMMDGGWNPAANINRATMERGGGCSLTGQTAATPASAVGFMGVMLALALIVGRRVKETSPA